MNLYNDIVKKREKISLVGLGYVGLPIAVAFSKSVEVIGFDINAEKIKLYKSGIDPTGEVGGDALKQCSVDFTCDSLRLREAKFHIVAVPTPVRSDKTPDLFPVESSSHVVGQNLVKGSVVVFESTVYPGVTEDICVPILEKESGLKCGVDFKIGYSPERINPGDMEHRLKNIVKIVSGMDDETLDTVAKVYELVVEAGVYRASCIKVAEAAKAIENAQRDINIAFMNELSIIFNKLGIDTKEVLEAAGTKWNFMRFYPGLVGGHCIGVDPYYLTYKAEQVGYSSQVILAGRRINDSMGKFVAENTIKLMINAGKHIKGAKVAVLGFTFKENCPDTRNTRVIDIVNELHEYGVEALITDPIADRAEAKHEYGVDFFELDDVKDVDAVIIAVGHREYIGIDEKIIGALYGGCGDGDSGGCGSSGDSGGKILVDVKGILSKSKFEDAGFIYWRL